MIKSLTIALAGIASLMIAWIGIQLLWRRVFVEYVTDEDVLAGRTQCGNCGCTTACRRPNTIITKEGELKT